MMRWLWLFPLVLMTACAWLPEQGKRAEMLPAPAFSHAMNAARTALPLTEKWIQPDWWRAFKIPELNRLITAAVQDSPRLKRAAARLQQAQATADVEAADLYPTISGNISFSAQRFSANSVQAKLAGEHFRHLVIDPFILRYHLDLWGQDEAALQAAIGKAHAVETELAEARLLLASAVAKAYFDLSVLNAQDGLAGGLISCRARLAAIAKSRLDNGLSSDEVLLEAQKALLRVQAQQTVLRGQIERQKNLLAVLAGKGPDWAQDIKVAARLETTRPQLPQDLPLRLLSRRPDVQAAKLLADAAAEEIKVAQTAFYPDVNLIAFSGLHSVNISDVLLQGSSLAYSVGPSIDFPLFEGGRLRARLSYKEAAFDEAVESYNSAVLRAVQETADALAKWRETDGRLQEQEELVAAAENSRRLADASLREGLKNRVDSLKAEAEWLEQQLTLIFLHGESVKTAVQLYAALGGGYVNPSAKQ